MPHDRWHFYSLKLNVNISFLKFKFLLSNANPDDLLSKALLWSPFTKCICKHKERGLDMFTQIQKSWLHPVEKKLARRDRRYEKMLLLILDYFIWLMTTGSFILWERIVTFMAGRRPSKGLRAWQKMETVTEARTVLELPAFGTSGNWWSQCGASGGLGFCPDIFTNATQTDTHRRVNDFSVQCHCCTYIKTNNRQTETY